MAQKILVVDDEEGIIRLLQDYFEMQGYEVITARGGVKEVEKTEKLPDIILVDINMPDLDGFEVCRRIREYVNCPIVFLTAKIEEQDRINGLMMGGDDYIMKPFSIDELGARVLAHLRREERNHEKAPIKVTGDIVIRYGERMVYCNGNSVNLTKTEYDILELLSMNPGQIFGKENIYERIRGYDAEGDGQIVAEHIRRIRGKISEYTEKTPIETVWGVGYRWIG